MKFRYAFVCFLILGLISVAHAGQVKEHPALSAYEGAKFINSRIVDYAPYVLGLDDQEQKDEKFRGHNRYFSDYLDLEGKLTRIQYRISGADGIYKVFKNYEQALKDGGYNILFTTSEKESSWPFWDETVYHHEWGINPVRGEFESMFPRSGFRFLTASGKYKGNNIYFAIFFNKRTDDDGKENVIVTQDVIEINPLKTGLVTAKRIEENVELDGFVSLYGIHFEKEKWDIKEESAASLKELADFLKKNPDKKYFIVGHTDNDGSFDYNLDLSEKRAGAVKNWLLEKHGVPEKQLTAQGVASLSPVTSNSTAEGKARNRRVEIVEQ